MTMTTGSEVALSGQVLLIDRDGSSARVIGASLRESMLVTPEVTVVEAGRAAAELLRQARFWRQASKTR